MRRSPLLPRRADLSGELNNAVPKLVEQLTCSKRARHDLARVPSLSCGHREVVGSTARQRGVRRCCEGLQERKTYATVKQALMTQLMTCKVGQP